MRLHTRGIKAFLAAAALAAAGCSGDKGAIEVHGRGRP